MRHVTHVQWNPVNMVTNGPRKIGGINRVAILTRVFFYKKMYGSFCQVANKRGRKAGFHCCSMAFSQLIRIQSK